MKVCLITACMASFTSLVTERADATFANGVETFAGNVFDTSTWQVRRNSLVIQNNSLTITSGEVVTVNPLVPVGCGARVPFVVSQIPGVINNFPGGVSLNLTTASAGTGASYLNDSLVAQLDFSLWAGNTHQGSISQFIFKSGSGTGLDIGLIADSNAAIGRTFTMEIDRPTSQQYSFSFLDSNGDTMAHGRLSATSFPGPLYIDLYTDGFSTATFNSVTIVPEPAALSLLAVGGVGVLKRRTASKRFLQ